MAATTTYAPNTNYAFENSYKFVPKPKRQNLSSIPEIKITPKTAKVALLARHASFTISHSPVNSR